jgi:ribonuclease HI
MSLEIYTDGSCLGNPGPGGWAYLMREGEKTKRGQGGEAYTTNNRMELSAVIEALRAVDKEFPASKQIQLYTDSSWVVNTMTKNWKRKKNLDLWEELAPLLVGKHIEWNWVKGHNGHPENEDCDSRANAEAKKMEPITRSMDPKDLRLPGAPPELF